MKWDKGKFSGFWMKEKWSLLILFPVHHFDQQLILMDRGAKEIFFSEKSLSILTLVFEKYCLRKDRENLVQKVLEILSQFILILFLFLSLSRHWFLCILYIDRPTYNSKINFGKIHSWGKFGFFFNNRPKLGFSFFQLKSFLLIFYIFSTCISIK